MIPIGCKVVPLGQVGYRFDFEGTTVLVDPYLSDSITHEIDSSLRRLFPIPELTAVADGVEHVLVTHGHEDHCDRETLVPISRLSLECSFIGPPGVLAKLSGWGIADDRLTDAGEEWIRLAEGFRVRAVPAAHPEVARDHEGKYVAVGYVFDCGGRRVYHAGDTSVSSEVIESLRALRPIEVGFIPVNERNYYREARGIVGNMSVRDAFSLCEDLGIAKLVPTHWDMFEANAVFREEIELLHSKLRPSVELVFYPSKL